MFVLHSFGDGLVSWACASAAQKNVCFAFFRRAVLLGMGLNLAGVPFRDF